MAAPHMPATNGASRFDAIPGPLGLEAASLKGKVALVTGAGMCLASERTEECIARSV